MHRSVESTTRSSRSDFAEADGQRTKLTGRERTARKRRRQAVCPQQGVARLRHQYPITLSFPTTSPPVQIEDSETSILALDAVRLQRRFGTGKSLTFEKLFLRVFQGHFLERGAIPSLLRRLASSPRRPSTKSSASRGRRSYPYVAPLYGAGSHHQSPAPLPIRS